MGGAVVVAFIGYRLVLPRPRPMFEGRFQLPTATRLDAKLIGGSALFGIGWGIAGFCPGGALPALGTGRIDVILFTVALLAGIFSAKGLQAWLRNRNTQAATGGA
jgi:hypothetical protein